MSVLIKGMEMPKNCDSCPCYYETEGAWRNECEVLQREHYITDERPDWCPLVEIPPHGRLIDADVLMENEENISFKDEWHMTVTEAFVSVKNIAHAPTIIESTIGQLNSDSAVNEANANTSNAFNALDCVEESEAFR